MIASEWSNDLSFVGQRDAILLSRWEQTLKQRNGRVENRTTFAPVFDAHLHLIRIDKVRTDPTNEGRRGGCEVLPAKVGAELMRLNLPITVVGQFDFKKIKDMKEENESKEVQLPLPKVCTPCANSYSSSCLENTRVGRRCE